MKPIRLAPEAYRLGHCFSVTLTTANRERLFHGNDAAEEMKTSECRPVALASGDSGARR